MITEHDLKVIIEMGISQILVEQRSQNENINDIADILVGVLSRMAAMESRMRDMATDDESLLQILH